MYTVFWHEEALTEVMEVWSQAASDLRERISQAMREIEQMLAVNPVEAGESREGKLRILCALPLVVDEAAKQVQIRYAWVPQRRR